MPLIPNTISILHEIAEERRRQVEAEGYTPAHDDLHDRGELARAASFYAMSAVAQQAQDHGDNAEADDLYDDANRLWPFERQAHSTKPARRRLIIAAALLVAEIERLDRASA